MPARIRILVFNELQKDYEDKNKHSFTGLSGPDDAGMYVGITG